MMSKNKNTINDNIPIPNDYTYNESSVLEKAYVEGYKKGYKKGYKDGKKFYNPATK